ncbi:hypothetical protein HJG60_008352 [Phyllostomus discolor]|uniref:Uncharacterized protein n=1 Tax=Phyllostomus discolor TaxID=89673 RepID=A0A833Z9J3_9CHIR|nr:hypothetical protein HJG60_008352 [Phyllostomus discolor]
MARSFSPVSRFGYWRWMLSSWDEVCCVCVCVCVCVRETPRSKVTSDVAHPPRAGTVNRCDHRRTLPPEGPHPGDTASVVTQDAGTQVRGLRSPDWGHLRLQGWRVAAGAGVWVLPARMSLGEGEEVSSAEARGHAGRPSSACRVATAAGPVSSPLSPWCCSGQAAVCLEETGLCGQECGAACEGASCWALGRSLGVPRLPRWARVRETDNVPSEGGWLYGEFSSPRRKAAARHPKRDVHCTAPPCRRASALWHVTGEGPGVASLLSALALLGFETTDCRGH